MDEELRVRKRTQAPYWWPDSSVVMQMFLAVSIVYLVWYIIHQLLSGNALKIDPSVRDLVVFIFGIVFGNFKDVFGYTFGSSAGQKKQGEAITKSLEDKDKIIATNVSATADATTAALAAATAVAPLAAKVEAPPAAAAAAPAAAEAAAPAAAKAAVEDALKHSPPPSPDAADPKFGGKP
jgi:cytoskeletal protein RodZ